MAKVLYGGPVADVSGSVGGVTFSRNRYGTYMRRRTVPTISTTEHAIAAKARMTNATQAWQGLTIAQQNAWNMWADANPVSGSLASSQLLTGHAAFVGIYCRHTLCGAATLTLPPITPAPVGLTTCSVVADKTGGTCFVTFTGTPTAGGVNVWYYGCYVASQGKHWVNNLFRWCSLTGAAVASPVDLITPIEARLGVMTIGHRLILLVHTFGNATGLLSSPLRCEDTII